MVIKAKSAPIAKSAVFRFLMNMGVTELTEKFMALILKDSICQPIPPFLLHKSIAWVDRCCLVSEIKDKTVKDYHWKVIRVVKSIPIYN